MKGQLKPYTAGNPIESDLEKLDLPTYIDRPEYVKNPKVGYALQAVGWLVWMWLFLPIITVILWLYEAHVFFVQIINQPLEETLGNLFVIGIVIGVLIVLYLGWAFYNWFRFHGKERRSFIASTADQSIAQFFDIETNDVVHMKEAKILTLHYDDGGQLVNYDIYTIQKEMILDALTTFGDTTLDSVTEQIFIADNTDFAEIEAQINRIDDHEKRQKALILKEMERDIVQRYHYKLEKLVPTLSTQALLRKKEEYLDQWHILHGMSIQTEGDVTFKAGIN